jgi:glycosyltransferase involved in cell wall biosynthesis
MRRLYIFDPNIKNAGGHYLQYAVRVARATESFGMEALIVANTEAPATAVGARTLPVFQFDYWQEMCPPKGKDPHDHLAVSAERFAGTLGRIQNDEQLTNTDILFFPYVNLAEIMGVARWRRAAGITPRTVLLFRRELDEQGLDSGVGARGGAALLRQSLADLYACPGNEQIRLLTDSDNLTEEYSETLRRRFQTAPIPVDPALFAARLPRFDNRINLLYLGDARTEKGYLLLPSIARAFRPALASGTLSMIVQSNFNVAGGEPGIAAARDFLSTLPNVTLLDHAMACEEYNEYLLTADLVLLPYQADRYVSRTSGILAEAICAGAPAIVPQGTWLADQVWRRGAGIIYQPLDPDGPAGAVAEALASLDVLKERAEDRRAAYAHFHRPARLAEYVCGAEAVQCPA